MFPATKRLTKTIFSTIKTTIVYRGEYFDVAKKNDPLFKIACVISKKRIKKATERNKTRRRILHALSLYHKTNVLKGFFVIYPKPVAKEAEYQKIEEEIFKAFDTLQ